MIAIFITCDYTAFYLWFSSRSWTQRRHVAGPEQVFYFEVRHFPVSPSLSPAGLTQFVREMMVKDRLGLSRFRSCVYVHHPVS